MVSGIVRIKMQISLIVKIHQLIAIVKDYVMQECSGILIFMSSGRDKNDFDEGVRKILKLKGLE